MLIDAHNHLQDERLHAHRQSIVAELRERAVTKWSVNGTSESDWDDVANLARLYPEVVPFFGLHPWYVNERGSGWKEALREKLRDFPNAGVGEVGLDKWVRGHDICLQRELLMWQWRLAIEWKRPLTIHCLRAFGSLLDCAQEVAADSREPTPPFLIHSYSGPRELVAEFCELGAYFSVSGYFFHAEKKARLEVFREIPADRILIETDAPDMGLPQEKEEFPEFHPLNHPGNLSAVYRLAAQYWDMPVEDLVNLAWRNSRHFFSASAMVRDRSSME